MTRYLKVGTSLTSFAVPPPTVSVALTSGTLYEGNGATFRISLSRPWVVAVTVDYATSNGTGSAGTDYTTTSGTATFVAGVEFVDVTVPTTLRAGAQASRTFTFTISGAEDAAGDALTITTAAQTVTILDTQETPTLPTLSVAAVAPADEGSPLTFRVTADLPFVEDVTFSYATSNGTAIAGTDYTSVSNLGTIPAESLTTDITVSTTERAGFQGARTVVLTISAAETASEETVTITQATATGTIAETEAPTGDNAHFEALTGHASAWLDNSFRSQAEINADTPGGTNAEVTYNPGADTHPDAQDAAKIAIPAYGTATRTLTTGLSATDTLIFISPAPPSANCGLVLNPGTANEEFVSIAGGTFAGGYNLTRAKYGSTAQVHASGSPVGVSQNSLLNQVRITLNTTDAYSYLFCWNMYFPSEMLGLTALTWKAFQFSSPGDAIWWEPRILFGGGGTGNPTTRPSGWNAATDIGAVDVRTYVAGGGVEPWTSAETKMKSPAINGALNAVGPISGTFAIKPNKWTRWFCVIEQVANDYDSFSMWLADEDRDPVLIYDEIPFNIGRGTGTQAISKWWLELNTSVPQDLRGDTNDLVCYFKNWSANRASLGTDWSSFLVKP